MKYSFSLFLFLLLSNVLTLSQSTNYNQVLSDLIVTKKWFDVENYYQDNKDRIDNEFVKLWYIAETGSVFNRPIDAINAYEQLLDKNLLNMKYPSLLHLFGQPALQLCADVQEYSKGECLCNKLIDILKNDTTVDPNNRLLGIQDLTKVIDSYKGFSDKYPILQVSKRKFRKNTLVQMLPDRDGGIYFNSLWNGISLRTHFDTGACVGGYIWNRKVADKIGVKLNTSDTITLNSNTIRGLMGVVDSLQLGPFCFRAVSVFVSIEKTDSTDHSQVLCDSIINSKFDIVLGTPLIKQLGIVAFDFRKKTMSFPSKEESPYRRNLYIKNSTFYMNMKVCDDDFLAYFDTGWRASGLFINSEFYNKHKDQIPSATLPSPVSGAIGGCNKASLTSGFEYKCPQIDIKIGDLDMKMINECSLSKDKENDIQIGTLEGGVLGSIIFDKCEKAQFDFNNMVFRIEKLRKTRNTNHNNPFGKILTSQKEKSRLSSRLSLFR
jgi:hypothetical protein